MLSYAAKRLLQLIPTLLGVAVITFLVMRLIPGDPTAMMGDRISEDVRARLLEQWHLDQPAWKQFVWFLRGIVTGDLGTSWRFQTTPVIEMVADAFANTLKLGLAAFILSVILGVSMGTTSALMKGTWVDRALLGVALLGISTPVFVVGVGLIILAVAVGYKHFGGTGFGEGIDLRFLVLPAIALGSRSIAYLSRMTRASILEIADADFLRTARAKGVAEHTVILKHMMRNALLPIITVIGLNFADYLAGAILVETVFQWPGIGFLLRKAIEFRDMPVIMAGVLFTTMIFVAINFLVDLAYAWADPRIRYA
jgi:ABC-type dipeptide/oligopeptide/nickel transport system permease component